MLTDNSLEKSLMLGKIEGRSRRGHQRMKWLDGVTNAMNMNLGKLREMLRAREALLWDCCWSVIQLCLTLCDPMDCSTPGLPVSHHLPKFVQVHVHCISNDIQLSNPLTHPSASALNLSQHQGLFQWVSCLHQVTKILVLQHQSFQWIFRVDFLYNWLVWSPCCPRDSQESSPAPILWCSAFFIVQLSHPYVTNGKTMALTVWTFVGRVMSLLFNTLSRFVILT